MSEFAESIGSKQSTVSRYESGKVAPSRAALLLLLHLAEGVERNPLLDALGVDADTREGLPDAEVDKTLSIFQHYLRATGARTERGSHRRQEPSLVAFARECSDILAKGREVEPAIVDVLRLWRLHGDDAETHTFFRDLTVYLDVQLTAYKHGRKGKVK